MNHIIRRHRDKRIHLYRIDPDTAENSNKAVKFHQVLDYDSDVIFTIFEKKNGEIHPIEQIRLSELLKAPKKTNVVFDSLRREHGFGYTWTRFCKERAVKLTLISQASGNTP